jgi:hypothetical protein
MRIKLHATDETNGSYQLWPLYLKVNIPPNPRYPLDRRLGETLINSGHSGLEEKYPNAHAKE